MLSGGVNASWPLYIASGLLTYGDTAGEQILSAVPRHPVCSEYPMWHLAIYNLCNPWQDYGCADGVGGDGVPTEG